jgi:uncharacterized protein YndB with AHSA1/START domain
MVERQRRDRLTTARVSVEVDASPERVWAVISDARGLPRWDKHIQSVDVPEGGLGPGVRYRVTMRVMALRVGVKAHVEEWDPPRLARVRVSGPLLVAVVTTTVEPRKGGGSLLAHEVDYRFRGPLGGLGAASLNAIGGAQLALRHGAQAQKREAESGA